MSIRPLGNRVLVRPAKKKEKARGGFILSTSTSYEKTEEIHGDVIAIGPLVETVKVGDLISYPAYGYDTVTDDSTNSEADFMCIREPEILAVLERMPEDVEAKTLADTDAPTSAVTE